MKGLAVRVSIEQFRLLTVGDLVAAQHDLALEARPTEQSDERVEEVLVPHICRKRDSVESFQVETGGFRSKGLRQSATTVLKHVDGQVLHMHLVLPVLIAALMRQDRCNGQRFRLPPERIRSKDMSRVLIMECYFGAFCSELVHLSVQFIKGLLRIPCDTEDEPCSSPALVSMRSMCASRAFQSLVMARFSAASCS